MGPIGGGATPIYVQCELPDHRFYEAADFLVSGHPWPKQLFGPVTLNFSYDFEGIDPRTREKVPLSMRNDGVTEKCSMLVQLQRNSFIQPDLLFAYNLEDPRLYGFLSAVVPKLPFKLRAKNFRRRTPLKGKDGFKFQRIRSEELGRLSEFER